MALKNETQVRLTVYSTILVVLFFCGFVFFQFLRAAENSAKNLVNTAGVGAQSEYAELDLTVLESKKFKDLKPVVVPVPDTPEEVPIDDNDLDSLRKKSNPFVPSF